MSLNAPHHTVVVVMPAFNTSSTIRKTVEAIPPGWIDRIVLVDDGSSDSTVEVAESLGIDVISHAENSGYGAAQKTGYCWALAHGADIVVLLHSDYQYSPVLVPEFVRRIATGEVDAVTGSRIRSGDALKGGMPLWKYIPNRALTILGNLIFGTAVSEFHNGYRAYSRAVLESVPFNSFSQRFDFDTQIILHLSMRGFLIAEVPSPTRFAEDSSMMTFRQGIRYGLSLLQHMGRHLLHRLHLRRDASFFNDTTCDKVHGNRPRS